jgi:phosphopantetheinyl transferase
MIFAPARTGTGKILANFETMPIFFQQDIDQSTRLAVWKIEEEEAFFLAHVPLQRTITHPHKRLQHLAGRYLLKYLFPDFPIVLIRIADTRKPFLEDEAYHFSISHCSDYAAVIVSTENRVGVDIEVVSEKVERIRHKFVSDIEHSSLYNESSVNGTDLSSVNHHLSTLIWSCKEAVFKWYGKGEVEFKKHINIQSVIPDENDSFQVPVLFKKNEDLYLDLHSRYLDGVCLSYVVT